MRFQIEFRDQHGRPRKIGCFTRPQARRLRRDLAMNGVRSALTPIDSPCPYCGGDAGWECVCAGRILEELQPKINHAMFRDYIRDDP